MARCACQPVAARLRGAAATVVAPGAARILSQGTRVHRHPCLRAPCARPQDSDKFDTVCLATAAHRLANMRGPPGLHDQIVQSPDFFKLQTLICESPRPPARPLRRRIFGRPPTRPRLPACLGSAEPKGALRVCPLLQWSAAGR
jgi:hypothetical protein